MRAACARRARSWWARPTRPSWPCARSPRTHASGRRATPGIHGCRPAARLAGAPRRSPRAWSPLCDGERSGRLDPHPGVVLRPGGPAAERRPRVDRPGLRRRRRRARRRRPDRAHRARRGGRARRDVRVTSRATATGCRRPRAVRAGRPDATPSAWRCAWPSALRSACRSSRSRATPPARPPTRWRRSATTSASRLPIGTTRRCRPRGRPARRGLIQHLVRVIERLHGQPMDPERLEPARSAGGCKPRRRCRYPTTSRPSKCSGYARGSCAPGLAAACSSRPPSRRLPIEIAATPGAAGRHRRGHPVQRHRAGLQHHRAAVDLAAPRGDRRRDPGRRPGRRPARARRLSCWRWPVSSSARSASGRGGRRRCTAARRPSTARARWPSWAGCSALQADRSNWRRSTSVSASAWTAPWADDGPLDDAHELAAATATAERDAREWLEARRRAGSSRSTIRPCRPAGPRYALPPERADVLLDARASMAYIGADGALHGEPPRPWSAKPRRGVSQRWRRSLRGLRRRVPRGPAGLHAPAVRQPARRLDRGPARRPRAAAARAAGARARPRVRCRDRVHRAGAALSRRAHRGDRPRRGRHRPGHAPTRTPPASTCASTCATPARRGSTAAST